MTSTKLTVLCASAWLGLVACKTPAAHEAEPASAAVATAPVAQPTTPVTPQPTAARPPGDKPTAKELPVPEDFHPEVSATIVRANYRAELDAIETELHAEAH